MKVLVADKFEAEGLDALRGAGCAVVYEPEVATDALAKSLQATGAEILVVRSTKVPALALANCSVSLVVRAGAGVDNIDVGAASKLGIYVANCPGKNAIAVAELTMALLLAVDRRIPDNVADLRMGIWNKKEYSKAQGLCGRTFGLLGYGRIAAEVAARAHAFGMNVQVWSRRFAIAANRDTDPLPDYVSVAKSPLELASLCDVLSVHLALSSDTRGFVGREILQQLHDGAIFLNTARAEIVDYAALLEAIDRRGLRVGLDVFPNEPSAAAGPFDSAIAKHPRVFGTHHIGASTEQAQAAIAAETVRIVVSYVQTGKVPNLVNLARKSPATHLLVVRHLDRPGVLAHVFDLLKSGAINVQETENVIFDGAHAAVARIHLDRAPSSELLDAMQRGNPDILEIRLVAI